MGNSENNYNSFDGIMNAINIISLLIGLQNLELNVTANDIDNQTNAILSDLHDYFDEQNKHLAQQDRHLNEQDMKIERIERLLYGDKYYERRESDR